jgi:D-beta-D-heptose 7-phosphate kinase/D-beta-D-heptose 1-phosphate adenosyltransferase
MIKPKIKSITRLKKIIKQLKAKGKKIVFTNGCFDLLHYGHVKYLQDAKKKGDILIVGINSDASVRKIKGKKRPLVHEKDRLRIIAALESVDYVVLFKEDSPLKIIKSLRPDVLIKGADWNKNNIVGSGIVLSYGGKVNTIELIKERSTTNLIKKIAKSL